jgi:hypothetical protein
VLAELEAPPQFPTQEQALTTLLARNKASKEQISRYLGRIRRVARETPPRRRQEPVSLRPALPPAEHSRPPPRPQPSLQHLRPALRKRPEPMAKQHWKSVRIQTYDSESLEKIEAMLAQPIRNYIFFNRRLLLRRPLPDLILSSSTR